MRKLSAVLGLLAVALALPAGAARNTGGAYTLPLPPVQSGTVISSTWANTTLADIKVALTDSLSRDGYGAMRAPLRVPEGSSAIPAFSWSADTTSGLYLGAASDVRMSVASTQVQRWTTATTTVSNALQCSTTLAVTGNTTLSGTLAVTGSSTLTGAVSGSTGATFINGTANAPGLTATGNGTSHGVVGNGGNSGSGTTTGIGVLGNGGGSGPGVRGVGGSSGGDGIVGIGAGASGRGVNALGAPGQAGGIFTAGTTATSTVPQTALISSGGYIGIVATNPNSNVGFTNTLTPLNIPKAWGLITTTGGGSTAATVTGGANVTNASVSGLTATVTLAQGLSGPGIVIGTFQELSPGHVYGTVSGSTVSLRLVYSTTSTTAGYDLQSQSSRALGFVVYGPQ